MVANMASTMSSKPTTDTSSLLQAPRGFIEHFINGILQIDAGKGMKPEIHAKVRIFAEGARTLNRGYEKLLGLANQYRDRKGELDAEDRLRVTSLDIAAVKELDHDRIALEALDELMAHTAWFFSLSSEERDSMDAERQKRAVIIKELRETVMSHKEKAAYYRRNVEKLRSDMPKIGREVQKAMQNFCYGLALLYIEVAAGKGTAWPIPAFLRHDGPEMDFASFRVEEEVKEGAERVDGKGDNEDGEPTENKIDGKTDSKAVGLAESSLDEKPEKKNVNPAEGMVDTIPNGKNIDPTNVKTDGTKRGRPGGKIHRKTNRETQDKPNVNIPKTNNNPIKTISDNPPSDFQTNGFYMPTVRNAAGKIISIKPASSEPGSVQLPSTGLASVKPSSSKSLSTKTPSTKTDDNGHGDLATSSKGNTKSATSSGVKFFGTKTPSVKTEDSQTNSAGSDKNEKSASLTVKSGEASNNKNATLSRVNTHTTTASSVKSADTNHNNGTTNGYTNGMTNGNGNTNGTQDAPPKKKKNHKRKKRFEGMCFECQQTGHPSNQCPSLPDAGRQQAANGGADPGNGNAGCQTDGAGNRGGYGAGVK